MNLGKYPILESIRIPLPAVFRALILLNHPQLCLLLVANEHPRHHLVRVHPRELGGVWRVPGAVPGPGDQHAQDVLGQPPGVLLYTQHAETGGYPQH